jgi:hypothetical protein
MVQRMRAAQEAMESETKEEEFYLNALLVCTLCNVLVAHFCESSCPTLCKFKPPFFLTLPQLFELLSCHVMLRTLPNPVQERTSEMC